MGVEDSWLMFSSSSLSAGISSPLRQSKSNTGVTPDEMAALSVELENISQESSSPIAATPALESPAAVPDTVTPSPALESDVAEEHLHQAEAALEQELESIMSGNAAPTTVQTAAATAAEISSAEAPPQPTPATTATVEPQPAQTPTEAPAQPQAAAVEAALPDTTSIHPPVIIELLPDDKKPGALRTFLHDISLLIAQLFDMPSSTGSTPSTKTSSASPLSSSSSPASPSWPRPGG